MTLKPNQSMTKAFQVLLTLVALSLFSAEAIAQSDFAAKPICYETASTNTRIDELSKKIASGELELKHDDTHGYLKSVLDVLEVPVSSQMLVFSKTSFQLRRISQQKPRALYFNDDVYIGWVQRGDVLEVSAVDDTQGAVFYTLSQDKVDRPQFIRDQGQCMACHASSKTNGVPGHLVRSVFATASGHPNYGAGTFTIDHSSRFEDRWGGWFVSGTHGKQRHMGNVAAIKGDNTGTLDKDSGANITDLKDLVNTKPYLSKHSDIVALMMLEHQTKMHNLITKASFETRSAIYSDITMNKIIGRPPEHRTDSSKRRIQSAADKLVQYMLYSEEYKLTSEIKGTSGFAEEFTKKGRFDSNGRSLSEFDLRSRMMKYPCSHLVYSRSFDQLPDEVKSKIYQSLFKVLSNEDQSRPFEHLSAADRQAILVILRETKDDLPEYWQKDAS